MKTYEITASIKHDNDRNKNLCFTEHYKSKIKANNETQALKLAIKEIFNKTGFFLSADKITLKSI